MDFFKKASSFVESSTTDEPKSDQAAGKHSTTELLTSAKVVAGAAQSTLANKSEEIDKANVAGAAGDLLGAAKEYGKFDEKQGLGQYVGQAETYLRSYGSSGATEGKKDDVVVAPPAADPVVAEEKVVAPAAAAVEKVVVEKKEEVAEKSEEDGVGDYLKVAGGLSSKLF